jgi:hypothetical protein
MTVLNQNAFLINLVSQFAHALSKAQLKTVLLEASETPL